MILGAVMVKEILTGSAHHAVHFSALGQAPRAWISPDRVSARGKRFLNALMVSTLTIATVAACATTKPPGTVATTPVPDSLATSVNDLKTSAAEAQAAAATATKAAKTAQDTVQANTQTIAGVKSEVSSTLEAVTRVEERLNKRFDEECMHAGDRPSIYSIGLSNILILPDDVATNPSVVVDIPVEGSSLRSNVNMGVVLTGVASTQGGDTFTCHDNRLSTESFEVPHVSNGSFVIRLKQPYLKQLRNNDRITLWISLNSDKASNLPFHGSRTFTVLTAQQYRDNYSQRRIPVSDIRAFPLPEAEAERLFGPVISQNFFAIRLSVRNESDAEKFISVGMIRAAGRILVEPVKKKEDSPGTFMIPVELTPQSLEQVYTIVGDSQPRSLRAWMFRTLEFGGALATSINTAFAGSEESVKALGILTGVFMPQLGKLFPDPWEGYKRNLVAFAMQDVTKVAQHDISAQKYVFFSKNRITGLIADPNQYNGLSTFNPFGITLPGQSGLDEPKGRVVSVQFDSLDIPFESTEISTSSDAQKVLLDVFQDLRDLDLAVASIAQWSNGTSKMLGGTLTVAELTTLKSTIDATKALSALSDEQKADLQFLDIVRKALSPGDTQAKIIENTLFGPKALSAKQGRLDEVRKDIVRGGNGAPPSNLLQIKADIEQGKKTVAFIVVASKTLHDMSSPTSTLVALKNVASLASPDANKVNEAAAKVHEAVTVLKAANDAASYVDLN